MPTGPGCRPSCWTERYTRGRFPSLSRDALDGDVTHRRRDLELVPRFFRNMKEWASGVNGISALDVPTLPFWITGPWVNAQLGIEQNFRFSSFDATPGMS